MRGNMLSGSKTAMRRPRMQCVYAWKQGWSMHGPADPCAVIPLVNDGFTCLGTDIGSADVRHARFRTVESQTQDLLERMRPLADNNNQKIAYSHAHPQCHIQAAFLDRVVPHWRDSTIDSWENLRCMDQQPPPDQQHAGFGIGGLADCWWADSFKAHYYITILKRLA